MTNIITFFARYGVFIAVLAFSVLWHFYSASVELAKQYKADITVLEAANHEQANTIAGLIADRERVLKILKDREGASHEITQESQDEAKAVATARKSDATLDSWLAAPLPNLVIQLYGEATSTKGAGVSHAAGATNTGNARAGTKRQD